MEIFEVGYHPLWMGMGMPSMGGSKPFLGTPAQTQGGATPPKQKFTTQKGFTTQRESRPPLLCQKTHYIVLFLSLYFC